MGIGQGKTISIVGAGVSGLAAACALARLGYQINIYERSPDPRQGADGASTGSVVLTTRCINALRALGLDEDARRAGVPLESQILHRVGAGLIGRLAGSDVVAARGLAIPLADLRQLLLRASAKFDNIEIFFGQRCVEVDAQGGTLRLAADNSTEAAASQTGGVVTGSLIIGADGAQSMVRRALQLVPGFEFSQTYASCVTKRATSRAQDPAGARRSSGSLQPIAAHVWARCGVVVTALPRPDGGFDCTVHGPARGPVGLEAIRSRPAAEAFLTMHAPQLLAIDPALPDALAEAPVQPVMAARCPTWTHQSSSGASLVLVGDAAHAAIGLLGLDTAASLEDGVALGECVEQSGGDLAAALERYQERRCDAANSAADTLSSVLEALRSKTETRLGYARTLLERAVADMLPSLLAPPASVLAAPDVPLDQAAKRADRLQRVLRGIGVMSFILVLLVLVLLRVPAWPLLVIVVISGWVAWELTRGRSIARTATR